VKKGWILIWIGGSIFIGWYFFELLVGGNSFLRVAELEKQKEFLKKEVEKLKKENAILQKKYFELKELENE
jgi:cell division protein FtsB